MSLNALEDMLEHKLEKEHSELLKREQTIKLLRLENTRLTKLTNEQSICICKYSDLLKLNGIKTNDK